MFQVIFVHSGSAQLWLDKSTSFIEGPCVIGVPGGAIHSLAFEDEPSGWVLTIAEQLLEGSHLRRSRELFEPIFCAPQALAFDANDRDVGEIARLMELIEHELDAFQLGQDLMLEWLIRMVFLIMRRRFEALHENENTGVTDKRGALYAQFRLLLEEHFKEHWTVATYAKAIAVSPTRLNRLCKSFAQKSASKLIQDRLVLEAERQLLYTPATAAKIAYDLGFQDPAYFARFFKRSAGVTPLDYRNACETKKAVAESRAS